MIKPGILFRDGLVFQAGKPIRVFGEGDGTITVTFHGKTASAAVKNGAWLVTFEPESYGGPYDLEMSDGAQTITVCDVWVGEVVLYSGQSNVSFRMIEESTPASDYVSDGRLRHFTSTRPHTPEPLTAALGWLRCKKEDVDNWSALSYLTGAEIRRRHPDVTVGVVNCSQGASVIQSWMPPALTRSGELAVPHDQLFWDHDHYPSFNLPGMLYYFMLKPLFPFSFGNVVWYQGESNTSPAEGKLYVKLLSAMVGQWRHDFDDAALPFVTVQIADTRRTEGWLLVQQAQLDAPMSIDHMTTVASADICEPNMIHPVTKSKLAVRITDVLGF